MIAQMHILHYSDYPDAQFETLYDKTDVLLVTGDLTLFDFGRLPMLVGKKPAFGVYGNHDSGTYLEELGIINLHAVIYEFAGLTWGGWQGCPRYKQGGGPQFSEEEAMVWGQTFPYVDVLVLHAGPAGMLDDPTDDVHAGSVAVRQYVLEKQPRFVFCGHQYSNAELTVGSTTIFRTYGVRIIEVA